LILLFFRELGIGLSMCVGTIMIRAACKWKYVWVEWVMWSLVEKRLRADPIPTSVFTMSLCYTMHFHEVDEYAHDFVDGSVFSL